MKSVRPGVLRSTAQVLLVKAAPHRSFNQRTRLSVGKFFFKAWDFGKDFLFLILNCFRR